MHDVMYRTERVDDVDDYTQLAVLFGNFSSPCTIGHVALGEPERMWSQNQFQQPSTEFWLFETRATLKNLDGVQISGLLWTIIRG